MDYPSKVLAKAVEEISGLPGIGKKSALRLALHLLKQPASQATALGDSLKKLVTDIQYCKECHNFSDSEICEICSNPKRSDEQLCVVEDVRDVMAIEYRRRCAEDSKILAWLKGETPPPLFAFAREAA